MKQQDTPRLLMASLTMLALMFPLSLLAKQSLDHEVYTQWNRITEQAISRDGDWAFWAKSPEEADGDFVIRRTNGDERIVIPRGEDGAFSHDSRHVVLFQTPSHEEARQARLDDVDEAERPKNALAIVNLASGERVHRERVRSFRLPEESGDWLAWQHGKPLPRDSDDDEGVEDESAGDEEESGRPDDQDPGTELVLRSLNDGEQRRFAAVGEYAFSRDGSLLAFTRVSEDGADDGVYVVDTASGETHELMQATGRYLGLAIDEPGRQVAFLFQPVSEDDQASNDDPAHALHLWSRDSRRTRLIADSDADFLADGWHVSGHAGPGFSDSGQRLFFGTAPAPVAIPDHDDKLDDEVVDVDIWHWEDDLLQPMQQEQLEEERKRSYLAVAHLGDGDRLVQLGREDIPEVRKDETADADVALGISNLPYQREISWDFPRYYDAWLIDMESGQARQVLKAVQSVPTLSPAGGYIHWWDRDARTWLVMDTDSGETVDVGEAIPHPLEDHSNDRPFAANPYGAAGWLADDAGLLLHDRHDLWLLDPRGEAAPRNLSGGMGRDRGWRFRFVDLHPDEAAIPDDQPLLLSTFDEQSKAAGFHHVALAGDEAPVQRLMSDHHYGTPLKAEEADRLLFTRESFQAFPDLRVAAGDFSDMRRLSEANPQQADYRWGTAELVEWESETGKAHQGMLFKPEDFAPSREYPMIIYFYERASDGLHQHRPPQAHRSVIIPSFYTSNDYVVFVPDVWYREGYPGDSAMESIMPKARSLAAEPWVDAERVGVQGHSWAGYKIAYMVTQTDFFRAAAGGAPVSNMTSAYGGIRWRTGMSRMFQYERTQSRLGKTLWEDRELYLHNSPLFKADRINTPLLMMHNDHDGAVPWEQGIELFTALRRLERPAWLVNYRDEPHWPTTFANRKDWQIRLQQFFDHYLKDEPAPRWLRSGIPAMEKGATLGYETD